MSEPLSEPTSDYFPLSYFGAVGLGEQAPPATPSPDAQLSDSKCLLWARETLATAGLFTWIAVGRLIVPPGSGDYPVAWIFPVGFREDDQVDPYEMVRILTYCVFVGIKDQSGEDQFVTTEALDQLSNSVANLLGSQGPPGSIAGMSRIETGKYDVIPLGTRDKPIPGEATMGIYLYGNMAYTVPGRSGRVTGNNY